MSVTIDTVEFEKLKRSIDTTTEQHKNRQKTMLWEIAAMIWRKARKLCLESPTLADYRAAGINKKISEITSGNLRDSIKIDKMKSGIEVGIPRGSKGAKYAVKIHDERGKSWRNLGPRSKRKGATDKFIFKAYEEEEEAIDKEINKVVNKLLDGIVS